MISASAHHPLRVVLEPFFPNEIVLSSHSIHRVLTSILSALFIFSPSSFSPFFLLKVLILPPFFFYPDFHLTCYFFPFASASFSFPCPLMASRLSDPTRRLLFPWRFSLSFTSPTLYPHPGDFEGVPSLTLSRNHPRRRHDDVMQVSAPFFFRRLRKDFFSTGHVTNVPISLFITPPCPLVSRIGDLQF